MVAKLLTVSVNLVEEVEALGLNEAVTPLGRLEAENVTLSVKPFVGWTLIVDVPDLPRRTVRLLGKADRLKFGPGVTVKVTVVVCVRPPEVPATVTVVVPVLAKLLALKVSVLPVLAGLGLNPAVTPLGRPEADKLTLPAKPLDGVILMVLEPLVP